MTAYGFPDEDIRTKEGKRKMMLTYLSPDDLTKAEKDNGITTSEVEMCVICKETFDPDYGPCVFVTSGEFQGARHVDWHTSCEISQGIKASTPFISGFIHVECLLEKIPEFKNEIY